MTFGPWEPGGYEFRIVPGGVETIPQAIQHAAGSGEDLLVVRLRGDLASARRSLHYLNEALQQLAAQGLPTENLRWQVQAKQENIRALKEAIGSIGIRPVQSMSQTLPGTTAATTAAAAAGGAGAAATVAELTWGARAGRWMATAVRVATLKALAVVLTAAVVGGGAYVISKWVAGNGETQPIAFIGPRPADECTVGVASEKGLVWSEETGWDLRGQTRPDPESTPYTDDPDGYRRERDAYVAAVNGAVYETFQEAGTRCTGQTFAIPTAEEMCAFLPAGMTRLAQPPLGDPARLADCVMKDSGGEGVRMWAEVLAFDDQSFSASQWLSEREFAISGSPEQLDIGDRGWLIKSTSPTARHVLAGTIGPIGFALYACEDCAGSLIGDLEPTARHIVDMYRAWAATHN